MIYNDLSIGYQNNNKQLNIKKYSNGSRLTFKIIDSTHTFVFPDNSEVFIDISGQSIKANKEKYYGVTSFNISDELFNKIPIGKVSFSAKLLVNGSIIYTVLGGILEIYPSCVVLEDSIE